MSSCRTASPFAMHSRIPSSEISMPLPRTSFVRMSFSSSEPSPHPRSSTLAPRGTMSRMMSWSIRVPAGLNGVALLYFVGEGHCRRPGKEVSNRRRTGMGQARGELRETMEDARRRPPDREAVVVEEVHHVRFPEEGRPGGTIPGEVGEGRQRGVEGLRHLEPVQPEPGVLRDPDDERLDAETRDGGNPLHRPEELHVRAPDPQFLFRLAHRGGQEVPVARVPAAARKADLPLVVGNALGSPGERHGDLTAGNSQRDENPRGAQARGRRIRNGDRAKRTPKLSEEAVRHLVASVPGISCKLGFPGPPAGFPPTGGAPHFPSGSITARSCPSSTRSFPLTHSSRITPATGDFTAFSVFITSMFMTSSPLRTRSPSFSTRSFVPILHTVPVTVAPISPLLEADAFRTALRAAAASGSSTGKTCMMLSTDSTTCFTPPTPSPMETSRISWGLPAIGIATWSPGFRSPLSQTLVGSTVVSPNRFRNLRKSTAAFGCIRYRTNSSGVAG